MIFDIVQTRSDTSAFYDAHHNERRIGSAEMPNDITSGGNCECTFRGEEYVMVYSPEQQAKGLFKSRKSKVGGSYQLTRDGQDVGSLCIKDDEGGIFNRFEYYSMILDGHEYSMYTIGLGPAGMKFPIYDGDTQLAVIEKDVDVYNHKDVYTVYAQDSDFSRIAFLFCIYMDMYEFTNSRQTSSADHEQSVQITTNKKLKEKYDPEFKHHVPR